VVLGQHAQLRLARVANIQSALLPTRQKQQSYRVLAHFCASVTVNTPSVAFSNFIAINGSFMSDTVASPIRDAAVAFSSSRDATLKTTEVHSDVDDDSDYYYDDSDSDYDATTWPVPISRLAHPASVVRPGTAAPHPQPQPAPASTSKATSKKVSPRRTATTSHTGFAADTLRAAA
jgi:hypothetical protein